MAMRTVLGLAVLAWMCAGWAWAGQPARGSAEEKAAFERHALASDQLAKTQPAAKGPADNGEITETLAPGERPSLRFMNKGGKMKTQSAPSAPTAPVAAPSLVNKDVQPPSDFALDYDLPADTDVTISIVGPDGVPAAEFNAAAGQPGGLKGKNHVIAWDGRDRLGREAPGGPYQALVVVQPGPGAPPESAGVRIIPLFKGPR
ncbi:MAG: hypothetical protein HY924_01505 [Elusimicrobia bacterium]|nr:hypothetical protein [Elusimicrobiota bacterium]